MPFLKSEALASLPVHIWRCDETLDEIIQILRAKVGKELADQYLSEVSEYKSKSRRVERLIARIMFHHQCGTSAEIAYLPCGRPLLRSHDPLSQHRSYQTISISHTRGYVAILFGNHPVGIDVEYKSEHAYKIASRFLSDDELQSFLDSVIDNTVRQNIATMLWSAKEAAYKFAQSDEVTVLDVALTPSHGEGLLLVPGTDSPEFQYVGTLEAAVAGKQTTIHVYHNADAVLTLAMDRPLIDNNLPKDY